jgi:hypothetical protein
MNQILNGEISMSVQNIEKLTKEINRLRNIVLQLNALLAFNALCFEEFLIVIGVSRGQLLKNIATKRNDSKAGLRHKVIALLHGLEYDKFIEGLQKGYLEDADITNLQAYKKSKEENNQDD